MLPDSWTVVAQHGGATTVQRGATIQSDLAVSLDPSGAGAFPAGSAVDAGMQWMVDFDAAVNAGMALRIPIDPRTRAGGFDSLFVYGLRGESDSTAGLKALFDAHRFSDGFAFVPQGAPTNNTPDASSAWKADESDVSYAVEQLPLAPPHAECDASRLAAPLAFPLPAGPPDP